MITLWARDQISGRRLKNKTREYLKYLEQGPVLASDKARSAWLWAASLVHRLRCAPCRIDDDSESYICPLVNPAKSA